MKMSVWLYEKCKKDCEQTINNGYALTAALMDVSWIFYILPTKV